MSPAPRINLELGCQQSVVSTWHSLFAVRVGIGTVPISYQIWLTSVYILSNSLIKAFRVCRSGGMVDATVSKTVGGNPVSVRL